MGSMVVRPTVQEMIKAAMAGASSRLDVSREASRQAENLGEKTASAQEAPVSKLAEYDQAMHLADAVEYIADAFAKEANIEPGKGPNALAVSESPGGAPVQLPRGKVTADSGMESPTKLKTTIDHPAGGKGHQELSISGGKGKVASIREAFAKEAKSGKSEAVGRMGEYLANVGNKTLGKVGRTPDTTRGAQAAGVAAHAAPVAAAALAAKVLSKKKDGEKKASIDLADALAAHIEKAAEDAINPAKISAGAAVAPDTSASGESGGAPVGGMPEGNTSLVSSIDSAINYTKGQAKAKSKEEMKAYTNEPALKDDGALAAEIGRAHV